MNLYLVGVSHPIGFFIGFRVDLTSLLNLDIFIGLS